MYVCMYTEADLCDLFELLKQPFLNALALYQVDVPAQVEDHGDPVGQAALGQLDRQREDAEHAVAICMYVCMYVSKYV